MKLPFLSNIINAFKKGDTRLNKRVVTFLFCLLLAAFFWVIMSLSKQYSIELSFPVSYINLPSDKVVANHLPETIDLEIKSNGFNLLFYKLKQKSETVVIDIKDVRAMSVKNNFYLLTNSRIDKITGQFRNDIKILKIYPDTLYFNFNKKIIRTVPVKSNVKIYLDKGNQKTDSIRLNPSFVRISGAIDLVEKIAYVETEPYVLKNNSDSLSVRLNILRTPILKLVDITPLTVQATIHITKYTEASIELPIEVENLPRGYGLKIFPDKVTVQYNVAFQNYDKINAMQFRAVVNYSKIEAGSNKLKIQLQKYPLEIKAVKMNPEKVEYIIKK